MMDKGIAKDYEKVIEKIDALMAVKSTVIVGIDGHCGAGKTTLAGRLGHHYGCAVIAMDDFYLPGQMKTPERLGQLGGNVYYERVLKEVLEGIEQEGDFSYQKYDCRQEILLKPTWVKRQRLYIVEGSYSMHPLLYRHYDLKVFLNIDPEKQGERILKRNGQTLYKRFVEEWIPLENQYFKGLSIKEKCDIIIEI